MITLNRYHDQLSTIEPMQATGVVLRVVGLTVVAKFYCNHLAISMVFAQVI